jgi:DNA-binding GntR family transcriptional regulator
MSRASDRAYDRIRDMILLGDLPPGTQIREEQLAETCGVSRTPVRDALRRLEGQAFIRRSESQRSFVAEWSLDDIADAFDLRAILESRAARRAAERMDPAALQRLRDCNRMIFKAVSQAPADIQAFLEANREFHAIILEKAASRRLSSLLSALIEQPVVWRTAHHYGREALLRSHGEHEELLAAFARHDGGWAEAVMSAHIHRAFHAYADAHQGLSAIDSAVGA